MTASAWADLLDAFERELVRAPSDEAGPDWEPPAEPLPPELAGRARDLLDRQRQLAARLRSELATVSEHLEAVRRIPGPVSDAPAYLDVAG
jgi:hypothetical protein